MSNFARDTSNDHQEEGPDWYALQEARMLSISSRVPERLRFARNAHHVEIISNISELREWFGDEAAAQLIAPVEDAITSAGWIARHEYGFPKGMILLQLLAWRPHTPTCKETES